MTGTHLEYLTLDWFLVELIAAGVFNGLIVLIVLTVNKDVLRASVVLESICIFNVLKI